ncbi:hypothetical protein DVR12_27445 [Chitinophaga silvatica]|uniref:HEAT repeat domain-containing protein n=1 Tax=Chitinophaga silvatica TaxID=2282649 RepID=A0A3E1Y1T1_9BACT|nr:hypothetical protein [Chitinophaga silvatica]RFS18650.1 hypothetical protein DVR12_27445 [Chitinophaga silvatica]
MKTLEEVKKLFENKSYLIRSEFINDYDFEDDYFEYYHHFLLNVKSIRDKFYLSDLIDLTGWLNIYDLNIRKRYYELLFQKSNYLVKLAVLDYFKYCEKNLLPKGYVKDLNLLYSHRQPEILRSQILFNLIICKQEIDSLYIECLSNLIEKTKDWKILHRLLSNLNEIRLNKKVHEIICGNLVKKADTFAFEGRTRELLKSICIDSNRN